MRNIILLICVSSLFFLIGCTSVREITPAMNKKFVTLKRVDSVNEDEKISPVSKNAKADICGHSLDFDISKSKFNGNSEFQISTISDSSEILDKISVIKGFKWIDAYSRNMFSVCIPKKAIEKDYGVEVFSVGVYISREIDDLDEKLFNIVLVEIVNRSLVDIEVEDNISLVDEGENGANFREDESFESEFDESKAVVVDESSKDDEDEFNIVVADKYIEFNEMMEEVFPNKKVEDDNSVLPRKVKLVRKKESKKKIFKKKVSKKKVFKKKVINAVKRGKSLIKAKPGEAIDMNAIFRKVKEDDINDKKVVKFELSKKNIDKKRDKIIHIPEENIIIVYSFENSKGDIRHTIDKNKFSKSDKTSEWAYKEKSPFKAVNRKIKRAVPLYECRTLFDTYFYSIKKSYIKGFCKKGEKPKRVFYVLKRFIRGAVPVIQMYNSKSNFAAYIVTEKQKKLLQEKGFEVSMSEAWGSPK